MSKNAESVSRCLPITALSATLLCHRHCLLVGQGPFLHIYDDECQRFVSTTRVFQVQAIHGIEVSSPLLSRDVEQRRVFVYGAASISTVSLTFNLSPNGLHAEVLNVRSGNAPDWILRAQCVAAERNGIIILTANNSLHSVQILEDQPGYTEAVDVELLAQGPETFLYSGAICSYDPNHVLVASGSVFGEVLIWQCTRSKSEGPRNMQILHRFEGHTGSVFGICISPEVYIHGKYSRYVVSCSDDRTIQVWDISDHQIHVSPESPFHVSRSPDTGFGTTRQADARKTAQATGHVSRIWDVRCLLPHGDDYQHAYVISRGEDATCKLWLLDLSSSHTTTLTLINSDNHHSGKNILAWTAYHPISTTAIVTGGADGRIVKRSLTTAPDDRYVSVKQPFHSNSAQNLSEVMKEYLLVNTTTVIALTAAGRLFKGSLSSTAEMEWYEYFQTLHVPVVKLSSNVSDGLVVFATKEHIWLSHPNSDPYSVAISVQGSVAWIRILSLTLSDKIGPEVLVLVALASHERVMLLHVNIGRRSERQTNLELPPTFIVTNACYDTDLDVVLLGSRSGLIASYTNLWAESTPKPSTFMAHESDAVTFLLMIGGLATSLKHVLSTGRDGRFAIHSLSMSPDQQQYLMKTLHQASPPFAMNIEGALCTKLANPKETKIMLYGFRSTVFIVWDSSTHAQVFAVECGGAHRSWSYNYDADTAEHAFVWTKSSTFNYTRSPDQSPRVIQEGGHGREIKALTVKPQSLDKTATHDTIIATGSEDTLIRLFAIDARDNVFDPLLILSDHTTGIQHLTFSSCGRYLFSSGGNGQLYAWAINDSIPIFGLGGLLLDKMPQDQDDRDARILSFDLVCVSKERFRIVAAYSNGKIKIVGYKPGLRPGTGVFESETSVIYGLYCLMQAQIIQPSRPQMRILAAGTNGKLNLTSNNHSSTSVETLSQPVHQSSILTLDHTVLSDTCIFVATGGDDNALGLTLLLNNNPAKYEHVNSEFRFNTILMPKAHAAALTALRIISHTEHDAKHKIVIVTVGNDQRIKVWTVTVPSDTSQLCLEAVEVSRVYEGWTCVADVSCIETLRTYQEPGSQQLYVEVAVVGIGMELLRLTFESWYES